MLDYKNVFQTLVNETKEYIIKNNLKAMVLGISGGIDSTVVASICHEVSEQIGVPFIGRSLPIKNKEDEFEVSKLVGKAFCSRFTVKNLSYSYKAALIDSLTSDDKEVEHLSEWKLSELEEERKHRKIANGNLQARCRMMYLYDIASRYEGIVMSTDNQTEYQLGFWTLHGDVGDFNPLFGLWKHEVYELANWIADYYMNMSISSVPLSNKEKFLEMNQAIKKSICLTPTDGLGISNSDLDQIGAKSYNDVDDILQTAMDNKFSSVMGWMTPLIEKYGEDVVDNVWDRHVKSNYKRNNLPIIIERNKYGE